MRISHASHLWFILSMFFIALATSTTYFIPQVQPYIYLRCALACIIPLFLLGFTFIQALFAGEAGLDLFEKTALSTGVSLALTPLVTLALNYTPYGINGYSAHASLTLLTTLFAAVALMRERRLKMGAGDPSKGANGQTGLSLREMPLAAAPLIVAVCLRVYPFLMSGLPFSVDAWPSIRCAEALLEQSPAHLGYGTLSGCDELGDRLFGAAISALTGLQPLTAMAFFLPITGATSTLILYATVKDIYNRSAGFLASLLLATAFTDVILTAGVKGETYAHPLYMLLIFLFLHKNMALWKKTLLFSVAGASLVLAHYYTATLTSAILASMGAATLILRWGRGAGLEARTLIFPLILALQVLAYLTLYARWAFSFLSTIDWISAASYQLISFVSALYLASKPHMPKGTRSIIACAVASLIAFTLAFLATRRPLVPGAPVLPAHYLLYAGPFIIAAPLSILGYSASKNLSSDDAALTLFWLATVLGLEGYAVFGNVEPSLGLTLAYRGINFLLPPLFILCALGLLQSLEGKASGLRGLVKASAITILIAILALNLSPFYAAIFMQERYIGYFWLHRLPEYRAGSWVSSTCGDKVVACDVKFTYLLRYYFNLKVDEFKGLLYLSGKSSLKPDILLTYDQMFNIGYVIYGGYSVDLPGDYMGKLRNLSLVYSNGVVDVYV